MHFVMGFDMSQMMDLLAGMYGNLPDEAIPGFDAATFKGMFEKFAAMSKKLTGQGAASMNFDESGMSMVAIMPSTDARGYIEDYRAVISESFGSIPGFEIKMGDAEKVGGVAFQSLSMKVVETEGQDPMVANMLGSFYGPNGMQAKFGAVGNNVVMTMGSGINELPGLVSSLQSGATGGESAIGDVLDAAGSNPIIVFDMDMAALMRSMAKMMPPEFADTMPPALTDPANAKRGVRFTFYLGSDGDSYRSGLWLDVAALMEMFGG